MMRWCIDMTKDEIRELAKASGIHEAFEGYWVTDEALARFAEVVARNQREVCAKIVERHSTDLTDRYSVIGSAIRESE